MKNKRLILIIWLGLLSQLAFAQLYEVPLNQRIYQSSYIFEGKVLESNSFYGPGGRMIYTSHLVQVYSVFKGEFPGDQVEIITEGGRVGDQAVWISHNLELGPNQHGIFFANSTTRPSDRQPNSGLSLRVYAGLQGFIEFHFDGINPKATEPFRAYQQPETELFPLIEARTGQARYNWTSALREINDFYVKYYFSYPQLSSSGGNVYLDFEIQAEVSGGSYEYGDAGIYIEYDTALLGSSLAGSGLVSIIAGDVTSSTDYSFALTDYGTNVLEIDIDAADPPLNLGEVDAWAEDVVKVRVDVTNLNPAIEALFEQSLMDGESYYYDDASGTYVQFPFVWAVDTVVYEATTATDTVTAFFPNPITAGTHLSSILTITGGGFGNAPGTVSFKNADDGGATWTNAVGTDYLLWSDSLIRVLVPSAGSNGTAGTGSIRITNSSTGLSFESEDTLRVRYALTNIRRDTAVTFADSALMVHLIAQDSSGGYPFIYHEDFSADTLATNDFEAALRTWRCATNVNFSLGGDTSLYSYERDSVNLVLFDTGIPDSLQPGELAKTRIYGGYTFCFDPTASIQRPIFIAEEIDLLIRDTTNWHYGTSTSPGGAQNDFYSMVLHELGHTHLLQHVIERDSLMHWAYGAGDEIRDISFNQLEGGLRVIDTSSIQLSFCAATPAPAMQPINPADCATLSVFSLEDTPNFRLFPNPSSSKLYIEFEPDAPTHIELLLLNSQGKLFEQIIPGRVFSEVSIFEVPVENLPPGIYLIHLRTVAGQHTQKFVKY